MIKSPLLDGMGLRLEIEAARKEIGFAIKGLRQHKSLVLTDTQLLSLGGIPVRTTPSSTIDKLASTELGEDEWINHDIMLCRRLKASKSTFVDTAHRLAREEGLRKLKRLKVAVSNSARKKLMEKFHSLPNAFKDTVTKDLQAYNDAIHEGKTYLHKNEAKFYKHN